MSLSGGRKGIYGQSRAGSSYVLWDISRILSHPSSLDLSRHGQHVPYTANHPADTHQDFPICTGTVKQGSLWRTGGGSFLARGGS